MSTAKRIVCLANANKEGARCVAGKELLPDGSPGDWIRPISDQRESGALVEHERVYVNRQEPALLDIVKIRVDSAKPESYQQENWVLTRASQCENEGQITWADLTQFVDSPRELWINGDSSSSGNNNRISADNTTNMSNSLFFIKVDWVEITTGRSRYGKQKKRGAFQHGALGRNYTFDVTDPAFEDKYANRTEKFTLGESFLTVSLAGEHDGYAYKLIAGIMQREEA